MTTNRHQATEHQGAQTLPTELASTRACQGSRRKRSDLVLVLASLVELALVWLAPLPPTLCTIDIRCFMELGMKRHNFPGVQAIISAETGRTLLGL